MNSNSIDSDLSHPGCSDTKGIYRNMCLASIVKIRQIVLKISGLRGIFVTYFFGAV